MFVNFFLFFFFLAIYVILTHGSDDVNTGVDKLRILSAVDNLPLGHKSHVGPPLGPAIVAGDAPASKDLRGPFEVSPELLALALHPPARILIGG